MVRTGSSYLSQSELPLTFGMAKRDVAERLVIQWPSGRTEEDKALKAGHAYECLEEKGIRETRWARSAPASARRERDQHRAGAPYNGSQSFSARSIPRPSINGGRPDDTVLQRMSKSMSKYAWVRRWRMPMIFDQGIRGLACRISSESLIAASPMISISLYNQ